MEQLTQFFRERRRTIIMGGISLIILVSAMLVAGGSYPIAVVNGQAISAERFRSNYRAAYFYAENLRKAYGATSTLGGDDLETQVLQGLVEAALIDQGVQKEIGSDLDYLIGNKMDSYEAESEKIGKAAETLYGLTYAQFRGEVLIPQAKKDILSGRLFLRGAKFDDWLTEAKRNATVKVFSNKFLWDGNSIRIR